MTRIIKFRAFDKIKNQMSQVLKLDLWGVDFEQRNVYLLNGGVTRHSGEFELMQFTGEIDKNNIEVYEGDIIPYHFDVCKLGVVKYGEYRSPCDDMHTSHIGFYLDFLEERENKVMRKDLGYWLKTSVVIGNIYETPIVKIE